jgi:hypothetical protein
MIKHYVEHLTSIRKQVLITAVALVASLAALGGVASPALATPKGEFAVFADCPLSTPGLGACLVAKTESGEITLNKQMVPITNPITLQGGFTEEHGEQHFVGAADGNTLSKSPQKVPGGLLGLVKCNEIKGEGLIEKGLRKLCEGIFENKLTGVNATTELAAPASSIGLNEENLLSETGVALRLPVKIKLENPLLGNNCYVGSNANPIILNLTTGTTSPPPPNKPIKGKTGTLESNPEGNILTITNNTLVDNAFSAPAATGCGGFLVEFLLDPIINAKIGLPSPAGHNTAILNGTLKQAGAEVVKEHE